KAQFVADVLNRTLATLITRCTKSEGTRDYFEVGVLGYSGSSAGNGLSGGLASMVLHPISQIEANPLRVESRTKKGG
ncbi:TPA: VWA domain-containing protein, partial [Stenotrophomonas maltophilia]